jgi:hypothetical protein
MGLAYIATCLLLILLIAIPIPKSLKSKLQAVLAQVTYYLALFSLVPAYITFNGTSHVFLLTRPCAPSDMKHVLLFYSAHSRSYPSASFS